MNQEEVLKLIPFYVTDTLSAEERVSVENELQRSLELQEEVKFWQRAEQATISYFTYLQEGHPSSEEIVDYAEQVAEGNLSQLIEQHLQQCDNCKKEFEIVLKTYPSYNQKPAHRKIDLKKTAGQFNIFRDLIQPRYVLPVIVVIIFLLIILKPWNITRRSIPSALVLLYRQDIRGAESQAVPSLNLSADVVSVDIIFTVPHTSLESIRYTIIVELPSHDQREIPGVFTAKAGTQFDSISVTMKKNYFQEKGRYRIYLTEGLPDSLHDITPEKYYYSFTVVNAADR